VTRADAAGADLDASYRALTNCLDFLQVWMPGAPGFIVCVTDIISEAWTFSADFTYF
jgi:hypothetical protein